MHIVEYTPLGSSFQGYSAALCSCRSADSWPCGLRLTDIELAAILAPELDPGAVIGPLHDPVQLGAFRGQDEPRDAESLAGVFELGAEFAAAVDPDRLERVWQVLDDGLQEPLRIAGGSPRVHPCRHELAGRAGCPELLERPAVSTDRHVVDLHHLAESGLPAAPGPALRMASAEVPSLAGLDVSAAEPAGLDPVEIHQLLQDAPDGGFRPVPAVTLQHDLEPPLAEEGVLLAHPAHGRLVGGRSRRDAGAGFSTPARARPAADSAFATGSKWPGTSRSRTGRCLGSNLLPGASQSTRTSGGVQRPPSTSLQQLS